MYVDGSNSAREIIEFADGIINWFRAVFEEHVSQRRFCRTDFVLKRISTGGKEGRGDGGGKSDGGGGDGRRKRTRRWERKRKRRRCGKTEDQKTALRYRRRRSVNCTVLPITRLSFSHYAFTLHGHHKSTACTGKFHGCVRMYGSLHLALVLECRCKRNKIFSNLGRHKKFTGLENNDFETRRKSRPSTLRRALTTIWRVVVSILCLSPCFGL